MKKECAVCGGELTFPCWIRRFMPTSPFHKNPGWLERYCSKDCYEFIIVKKRIENERKQKELKQFLRLSYNYELKG